jgi:hypothetical protein
VTLSPRWEGRCGPEDGAYAKVDDVIACFHYLLSLDTRPCRSIHYPNNNRLCQAGGAQIFVFTTNIKHAESYWQVQLLYFLSLEVDRRDF